MHDLAERHRRETRTAAGSVPVVTGLRRLDYLVLTILWLLVNVLFWSWWLLPDHRGSTGFFVVGSAALAYLVTILPSFFWFFVGRTRRPPEPDAPAGMRVAMITLCVPSHESLDVIARQLEALTEVRYPHDSWVLDEGGDPGVRALADAAGVRYFTRRGVERWNQPGPPFQAKTKAGNVNAWLDHVAAEGLDYEAFVQLDIDHLPMPDYLDRTLGHLDDPGVAWVQAPSVAGNLDSWVARGLAEQDVVLQGPLQMGFYGHTRTPFIIGSHTTYRTSAVREIGGFQPTRAEDHLDTVVLAARGYRGVYVPRIIALGDGPEDLATYLGQQFAWAYSMMQILLRHTPRLVRRYAPGQAFQFLMAQSWYLLWSAACAVLWLLPIAALHSGALIADVELSQFLVAYLAVIVTSTLMWWSARDLFQPAGVLLSWRALVLELLRWPVVLAAIVNAVLGVKRPYMITPKGARAGRPAPGLRLYGPYLGLAWIALTAVLYFLAFDEGESARYVALILFNATTVVLALTVTITLETRAIREASGMRAMLRERGVTAVALAATAVTLATSVAWAWAPMSEAIS